MAATTCPYCGVGCGVDITPQSSGLAPVNGDQTHPANFGRLCVKGSSLHETLGEQGRLLRPRVRGQSVDWDVALAAVADGLGEVLRTHGPDAIAFYLSGQLLTEDYYVANKFAKGFLGTPHVDTNSRLCMSSAVAGYKRAFGEDAVPACYADLELADLLVIVGGNPAWNHPILYQRMKAAGEGRPYRRVVVVDPRRTASCEIADLHLPIAPGTDAMLFNGLLVWLADHGATDTDYLNAHCNGWEDALAAARASVPDLASCARLCDVPQADLERFFTWFAETRRTVTLYSQGINQSSSGTDKCNAIINCHLATGRVGLPGASPFSITGQPNAMGGREVGGLANQLAAHMDYDTPGARDRVRGFWDAPRLPEAPGLKAVDLFEAVHSGRIKAVWILGTNPAVSLPDAGRVREALQRCPLVIVSDCVANTDTAAFAHILLPATGWSEKDGTVTNSERCISRQRGILPPPGEARHDWWTISQVARRMGFATAFAYSRPVDIFREHAALSGFGNSGQRAFNISALAELDQAGYDALRPIRWPVTPQAPQGTDRLFADGHFSTPDGRARLLPITPRLPRQTLDAEHPVRLNTGRIRDQWHTMTRTGRAARLLQHRAEPFIDVHPADLPDLGLSEGDLAWVENRHGQYLGRVRAEPGQRPGEVFAPIHWNDQFTAQGCIGRLLAPVTDPVSGQPESKQGAVRLRRFNARWHARLLTRDLARPSGPPLYWSRVPLTHVNAWHLAAEWAFDPLALASVWLRGEPQLVMHDPSSGRYRAARFQGERLMAVLMVEPENRFPGLDWLDGCFEPPALDIDRRRCVLAGRAVDQVDTGPVVCACFQVGQVAIQAAIGEGCTSVEALGNQLRCGTNCGSCVPEIKNLLLRAEAV